MKISVIATGGTIGSQTGSEGIRALRHDLDAIGRVLKNRPNGYPQDDLTVIYPFTLLSENMVPDDWVRLGEVIAKEIKKGADAIVVTHGTDTMAYSLSAVSFILSAVPVPIVFTGDVELYIIYSFGEPAITNSYFPFCIIPEFFNVACNLKCKAIIGNIAVNNNYGVDN